MLRGPPRHPPFGGLGGRSVPRAVCAALHPRKVWSARLVCKRRAGGRGAPARRLRGARCTPGGAPARDSTCVRLADACRDDREAGRRACGAQAQPLNEVGQGRPSQPGAALASCASKRRDGRNEGTVNSASVGTACQGCSSLSARTSASSRSSSSTSAAKVVKSASSFTSASP